MMHSGFQNRDILTSLNIPISLWIENGTHLFHKNTPTLVDKSGKSLCMKCIVEMFSSSEKSSTYLSKICEDLMLMIKCERGRGAVRFMIGELLSNECSFIFEEMNKVDVSDNRLTKRRTWDNCFGFLGRNVTEQYDKPNTNFVE
ncbi:hypothetical protein OJ253_476 [Cryptosporidium canis]|uniref:Uncharacterized protein n=1 Tax=Cryptosporidium canis TaxID=195482 RepID=A0A9D5DM17_9CRYT|nr:hypothetical protein OJ253_476 [Cryptosporidium canis]